MVIEANLIQLELPSKDLAAKDMVVAESVDLTLMLKSYQERPICRECSLPLVRHGLFNSDNFLSSFMNFNKSGYLYTFVNLYFEHSNSFLLSNLS